MSKGDSHIRGMVMLVLNFELNRFIKEINLGVAQALRKDFAIELLACDSQRYRYFFVFFFFVLPLMGKYIGFSY